MTNVLRNLNDAHAAFAKRRTRRKVLNLRHDGHHLACVTTLPGLDARQHGDNIDFRNWRPEQLTNVLDKLANDAVTKSNFA